MSDVQLSNLQSFDRITFMNQVYLHRIIPSKTLLLQYCSLCHLSDSDIFIRILPVIIHLQITQSYKVPELTIFHPIDEWERIFYQQWCDLISIDVARHIERRVNEYSLRNSHSTQNYVETIENLVILINKFTNDSLKLKSSIIFCESRILVFISSEDVDLTDQLRILETALMGEPSKSLELLYKSIQFLPNILPRLYLSITVAAVLMKKCVSSRNAIPKDLHKLCLGIQDPVHGLFLRHYMLLSISPNSLNTMPSQPDINLVEFLLQNFTTMKKCSILAPRSHQNWDLDNQSLNILQQLVGQSLHKLVSFASTDNLQDTHIFGQVILSLFKSKTWTKAHVRKFTDTITIEIGDHTILAQFFIHHVEESNTMASLLPSSSSSSSSSSNKSQVVAVTELLQPLRCEVEELLTNRIKAFNNWQKGARSPSFGEFGFQRNELAAIHCSLLSFALWLNYLMERERGGRQIGESALKIITEWFNQLFAQLQMCGIAQINPDCLKTSYFMEFLRIPIQYFTAWADYKSYSMDQLPEAALPKLFSVLTLPSFIRLFQMIKDQARLEFAIEVLTTALDRASNDRNLCMTSIGDLDGLMILVEPFLSIPSQVRAMSDNSLSINLPGSSSHHLLAQLHHLINPKDNVDLAYQLLVAFHDRLSGSNPELVKSNSVALIFKAIQLLRSIARSDLDQDKTVAFSRRTLKFIGDLIQSLTGDHAGLAIQLLLETALVIDKLLVFDQQRPSMVLDLMSKVLDLFDDPTKLFSVNKNQEFSQLVATISQLRCLSRRQRSTVCDRCLALATNHQSSKADQSHALARAASIYWPQPRWSRQRSSKLYFTFTFITFVARRPVIRPCQLPDEEVIGDRELTEMRDEQAVLSALDRSAKLAHDCLESAVGVQSLLDNLDAAMVLRLKGCSVLTDQVLDARIAQIVSLISQLSATDSRLTNQIKPRYDQLLAFKHRFVDRS